MSNEKGGQTPFGADLFDGLVHQGQSSSRCLVPEVVALQHLEKARGHLAAHQNALATQEADRALAVEPNNPSKSLRRLRGEATIISKLAVAREHRKAGDVKRALAEYDAVLALDSTNEEALAARANRGQGVTGLWRRLFNKDVGR